jgi:hypothetical protein
LVSLRYALSYKRAEGTHPLLCSSSTVGDVALELEVEVLVACRASVARVLPQGSPLWSVPVVPTLLAVRAYKSGVVSSRCRIDKNGPLLVYVPIASKPLYLQRHVASKYKNMRCIVDTSGSSTRCIEIVLSATCHCGLTR